METRFSPEQMADPATAESEAQIRRCVHCGFCTATCPTYVLLGDELDSPRGRIYLIKDMLENQRAPSPETVRHIDRCLSCLSCRTTCPSEVDYMRLIDHARVYVEARYRRPWPDRLYRSVLAAVLPYPARMRAALSLARLVQPFARLLPDRPAFRPLRAMLELAPAHRSATVGAPGRSAAIGERRGRVALMKGCAEPVLQPHIRDAAIRLLTRSGYEVLLAPDEGCCGALVHHIGRAATARRQARRNVDAWSRLIEDQGLDAVVVTASGCGTTLKDYGHLLRDEPAYAERAAAVSALAKDITEVLQVSGLPPSQPALDLVVAYHPACSLQHGQGVREAPKQLLRDAGYTVVEPK
jgi:glycolate oxidase iron-sulfur subunit